MKTTLVVDDHPDNCYLVSWYLEHAGYTVLQARDAAEALRTAAEQLQKRSVIRLAVIDIVIPGTDRTAIANAFRFIFPGFKPLYMTGMPPRYIRDRRILTPEDEILLKPFEREELLERVVKLIGPP